MKGSFLKRRFVFIFARSLGGTTNMRPIGPSREILNSYRKSVWSLIYFWFSLTLRVYPFGLPAYCGEGLLLDFASSGRPVLSFLTSSPVKATSTRVQIYWDRSHKYNIGICISLNSYNSSVTETILKCICALSRLNF